MSLTSSKWQELMKYLPDFYQSSVVMQTIMQAIGSELDSVTYTLSDILQQFFVETATWGLDMWEEMLGIPLQYSKPFEQRRSLIISKIKGIGTVNISLLVNVVNSYVNGKVVIIDNPESYSFTVKFCDIRGIPPNFDDVKAVIEEIKPAHLVVNYQFTYTLVGDLIRWGIKVSDLIENHVTVGGLVTWQR